MDVGASFQFMADSLLAQGFEGEIVALDWRGFGLRTRVAATPTGSRTTWATSMPCSTNSAPMPRWTCSATAWAAISR